MNKQTTDKTENKLLNWIKTHKFWMSVIVLTIITILIYIFGYILEFGALYTILIFYTLIGGLIWSGYSRKKGTSIITLGLVSLLYAIYTWWTLINRQEFELTSFLLAFVFSLASILFLFFGNKRYNQWKIQQHNRDNK